MWGANAKVWVTHQLSIEVFGPDVKIYLQENSLPLKSHLEIDSVPAHPPGLEDQLFEEFNCITIKLLPPHMSSLIQPTDQQVMKSTQRLCCKGVSR